MHRSNRHTKPIAPSTAAAPARLRAWACQTAKAAAASLALAGAVQAQDLTRLYAGNDQSALYTRAIGDRFFGFAEHPTLKYSVLLRGQIRGDRIEGQWWGLPKFSPRRTGRFEWQWSQQGARLVRKAGDDFGPDTFHAVSPSQIPWPGAVAAATQSASDGDVSGAYLGNDQSRWYLSQSGGEVVGLAEAAAQPAERPRWVSALLGTRDAEGRIQGEWIDLPKGPERGQGALVLTPRPGRWPRSMLIGGHGTDWIDPDFALKFDVMAKRIEREMASSGAVGWAYAIAYRGSVVRDGAGGVRNRDRMPALKFTPHTLAQAASFSKFATALTLARVLRQRGLDFNQRVAPFLPKCWKPGPGVKTMTFGDIASHHTGFTGAGLSRDDLYGRVRMLFERGVQQAPEAGAFDYQNVNYEVLRYLIPLLGRRDQALGVFDKYRCGQGELLNKEISVMFNDMMLNETLRPAGVAEASLLPSTGDYALAYNWQDASRKGWPPNPQGPYRTGAGYLAISARAAAQLLAAFDSGQVVPSEWVRTMKERRYGFDSWSPSKAGGVVWKNGGCPKTEQGHTCSAWGLVFPGGVQAYIVVNSAYALNGLKNIGSVPLAAYNDAFVP